MSGYIGAVPVPEATQNRTSHTATAGQTTFAVDYTVGFIDVFLNGIKLANEDFTATNGSSVVLASAAAVNDIFDTISYTAFNPADTVAASTGGTFAGNVAVTGNISVTGTVDGRDVAQAIPATLGSAGQVLTVNGGASAAAWASPAGSFASLSDTTVSASNPTVSTNPASGLGHIWINTTTGFLYVLRDATAGANVWTNVGLGSVDIPTPMTATGGTITTAGGYKIHTFNSSGTFAVSTVPTVSTVEYLVIGGGGGGGTGGSADYRQGGGGGAGGYLTSTFSALVGNYTITVGAGGGVGNNGSNSSIIKTSNSANIATAIGGGSGAGAAGGSGGGAQAVGEGTFVGSAGAGTSGQGNAGGAGSVTSSNVAAAGGGGGSSAVGSAGNWKYGGAGGAGTSSSITGTAVTRAGGGGGGGTTSGGAGAALGGNGGAGAATGNGAAGAANSGSGGGGAGGNRKAGASGGSGIVIIRYASG